MIDEVFNQKFRLIVAYFIPKNINILDFYKES